jgi:PAS domain S-box-containing protein
MHLRWKLILPLGAIAALLLTLFALRRPLTTGFGVDAAILGLALTLTALAIVAGIAIFRGPMATLERDAVQLACLRIDLDTARAALEREVGGRHEAEQAQRDAEARYALAVRGANDGLWEWDLARDHVYYSPLWKSLLGHGEFEIGAKLDEWLGRIHPDDRERVLKEMEEHLAGNTPRFENEHRLRHKDGSWHWVLTRGTAIRHATGKPYRVVGLHTDITARRAAEQTLLEVAESLCAATGEQSLQVLARSFAEVMGVREAFVCEPCDYPPTRARMLAWWRDGEFHPGVEYELEGTPCKDPQVNGITCYCPNGLDEHWPLAEQLDREAYLGIAIHDSQGCVIGHIACTDNRPMPAQTPHLAIFKLFAQRGGIELERRMLARDRRLEAAAA